MEIRNRLSGKGAVDRSKRLAFTFNGKPYEGYDGDTLASALLACGVRLIGRSFKYHRPRGIFTAGSEEPSAFVQLENGAYSVPNTRATMVELYDGLVASSENCWPSLRYDVGEINNLLAPLLPAGFYYKTFKWPASWWDSVYERVIRSAAGLGRAPTAADPHRYLHRYAHCDVLVIGGGPTGLAAALIACRSGARVILVEEQPQFGGRLLSDTEEIDGQPAVRWVEATMAELTASGKVTLLSRTTAIGYYEQNFVTAHQRVLHRADAPSAGLLRERLWKIRAKQVVLAAGAIERPLLFADNDRPGTMLASAVRTYINRFGVLPGRHTVVFTNNDSAYRTALDIKSAGGEVEVVDLRANPGLQVADACASMNIKVHKASGILATKGRLGLSSCQVAPVSDDGHVIGAGHSISCDVIACSAGWNPTVHLWSQARGTLVWRDDRSCFSPGSCPQNVRPAGAANGSLSLADCLTEGLEAGARTARDAGHSPAILTIPHASATRDFPSSVFYVVTPSSRAQGKRHFHDIHTDATVADIGLAAREGYRSVEHLKRYTTTGMGPDQGKTSNVNALAIMAAIRGCSIPEVGTTTFRPPFVPTTIGAIAGQTRGELFQPRRKTPMYQWHESHGAILEPAGEWMMPRAYLRSGESKSAAVRRECMAATSTAALFDASTIGKIEVRGPDAVAFLERAYCNDCTNLSVGHSRYGLMLNETGAVFDGGLITRLGHDHFLLGTSFGSGTKVMAWLERWLQIEWPTLQVYLTDVSEHWAAAAVWGPQATDILKSIVTSRHGLACGLEQLECCVAGIPARLLQTTFSGEQSYEIYVPARCAPKVWQSLMDGGKPAGAVAIGADALNLLRTERGFLLASPEVDDSASPSDLGLGWMVGQHKEDFLGKRPLVTATASVETPRQQLVGILAKTADRVFTHGAHLVEHGNSRSNARAIGRVLSSGMSPALGRSITLALLENGHSRHGETLWMLCADGGIEDVEVTLPRFIQTTDGSK